MAAALQLPARPAFVKKAWHKLVDASNSFFFAPQGQGSDDHLVEVVRRDPAVATWFIELTTFFSIVGSMAAAAACGHFLLQHWGRCGDCGRPLRWWLVGQVLLQMSQIPVRAVLFASVRKISNEWTIEACILSLTASPAWRLSKVVSLVLYGWFVLGVVWWQSSPDCEDCPGLSMLLGSVLLLSAARTTIALVASRELFPPPNEQAMQATPKVDGAKPCQIRVLPFIRVAPASAVCCSDGVRQRHGTGPSFSTCFADENCAVCLTDFDEGEWVRRLPCLHHFHSACIDRWLLQNKRCPLCMHPIDEVCMLPRLKNQ